MGIVDIADCQAIVGTQVQEHQVTQGIPAFPAILVSLPPPDIRVTVV